jgi:hypothetical protein
MGPGGSIQCSQVPAQIDTGANTYAIHDRAVINTARQVPVSNIDQETGYSSSFLSVPVCR